MNENYSKGKINRFCSSQFQWPAIERNNRANKVWVMFIRLITNNKGVLISLLNTSTYKLAHIRSNTEISNDNRYLRIVSNNNTTYFKLENYRGKTKIKQRVQSNSENF